MALVAAVLLNSGCRENTLIRSNVLPANDTVGIKSYTLPCITHTYYDGYSITSTDIGGIPIYQGVGVYEDPFFGTMTGATFFQLATTTYANPFSDMTVDSAILVLPYSGFTFGDTGNTSLTQTFQVFYMQDSLSDPSTVNYYASTTKPIDLANPLSDPITVYPAQLVAAYNNIDTVTMAENIPGLRIKLKLPALFKYLGPAVNLLAGSSDPVQDFFNTFHGICVMPANTRRGSAAIPYFRLDGSNPYNRASILVYYHDPAVVPARDTDEVEQYYFSTSLCSHFNNITRSYSRYPVNNLLQSTQANDSIITLQNQPGTCLDIVVPGIKSLPAGIINNAQLQLRIIPSYNPRASDLPERLYPVGVGSSGYPGGIGAGVEYNLADRYPVTSLSPLSFMDGFSHTINVNGTDVTTYTINLPREVMNSIAAKNDTIHIHLSGTQDFYGAYKMIAGGGSYRDTMYQPRLIVVYSKL